MEGTIVSLVPPLTAIILCIVLREAILALFIGIFVGTLLLYSFNPVTAFFRAADDVMLASLTDPDHAITLFFTILIGGLIEIFNQSPAARTLLVHLTQYLRNRRTTNLAIWFAGVVFFIDDYANSLIVGNSFRPIVDRMKISREKLAYLVDTTSAPITSLMLVSTWVGFEISLLNDALTGTSHEQMTGYSLFLLSIPYRFYPVLAIIFAFLVCWMCRDFGPMVEAETRVLASAETEQEIQVSQEKLHWKHYLAFFPILFLLISSIVILAVNGAQNMESQSEQGFWQYLVNIFSAAVAFRCLLCASLVCGVVSLAVHTLFLKERFSLVFQHFMDGCRAMFIVCVILVLAWSIGDVCQRLKTGSTSLLFLGDGFNPSFLPLLPF